MIDSVHHDSKELEGFIAEQSLEEKKAVVDEARQLLAEYEQRQLEISEKISSLEQRMREKRLALSDALFVMDDLQKQIADRDLRTIIDIDEYYEVQAIKAKIGTHEPNLVELQKEYDEVMRLVSQMEESARDKSLLDRADARLEAFYGEQVEKLEAHREDQRIRDANRVCKEHDCIFVHTISSAPQKSGEHNTALRDGVDWKQKLDINIGLQPEISTSTVRDGNPSDGTWVGDIGLLLKGGKIKDASEQDQGTSVIGGKRTIRRHGRGSDVKKEIDEAITIDRNGSYNELVLQEPEVTGILLGIGGSVSGRLTVSESSVVFDYAKQKGLPVYTRDDKGNFFKCNGLTTYKDSYDGHERKVYDIGDPVSVQDILENGGDISDEDKAKSREAVFENSPFSMENKERADFNMVMKARDVFDRFKDPNVDPETGVIDDYFIYQDHHKPDKVGYVSATTHGTRETRVRVTDKHTYIEAVKDALDLIVERNKEEVEDFREQMRWGEKTNYASVPYERLINIREESDAECTREVGFHLHEFARLAKKEGEADIAKKAKDVADELVATEIFEDVVERRIGPDGEFRITEEDLKTINTNGY